MAKSVINDPGAQAVLDRMHRAADRQRGGIVKHYVGQLPSVVTGKGIRFRKEDEAFLADKYIPIDRSQGELLYLLARATCAKMVVEFGTSFGVSTIYLACAVRDNGGGRVIGTEFVSAKAAKARENIAEAGLAEYVEILEGDARETLRSVEGPVDLVLIDGFPPYAREVLEVLHPVIRPGGVVVSDDVGTFKEDLAEYVRYLQDPANGYRSATVDLNGGTEIAVRHAQ